MVFVSSLIIFVSLSTRGEPGLAVQLQKCTAHKLLLHPSADLEVEFIQVYKTQLKACTR